MSNYQYILFKTIKTKKQLSILVFLLITFGISAQTNINSVEIEDLFKEETKSHDSFDHLIKSANDDVYVMDSSIAITYRNTYNDTTKYYYSYDCKKNIIEETIYTTIRNAASGFTSVKYQYSYDKSGNVVTKIYYDLDWKTKRWFPVRKIENVYQSDGRLKELYLFIYDNISQQWNQKAKIEKTYDEYGRELSETSYLLNESQEWIVNELTENDYQENGIVVTTKIEYQWDETLGNIIKQKTVTTIDEQGWLISIFTYNWDESENRLEFSQKRVHEYSEDGNRVIILFYIFDKNSRIWFEDERTEIVLENGKYIEYIDSEWDLELNQWIYIVKLKWTYDINGNETSDAAYSWNTTENTWEGNYKTETSYNSNGLLESVSNYITDTTNQWVGIDKKEYFYNESGKEILIINSNWNVAANDWIVSSKSEREYDSSNKEIASFGYTWDTAINDWIFSSKNEKEYNSNDQITLSATYLWDTTENEWKIRDKRVLEYDNYGHNSKVSQYKVYKDDVLELTETKEYFYSKLVTNINNIISEFETTKLYPNPANETFIIETQNPETTFSKLYNIKGELIKNIKVQQGINTYNISELKSGVYFIQIPQKKGVIVRKLIKN